MLDPGHGCGVGGGMLGVGDGCGVGEGMVGVRAGCGLGKGMVGGRGWMSGWMWGGWRGIGGRDKPRGSNRRMRLTSGWSCARAWASRSSCLLNWGLRDRRLDTRHRLHCRQHLSNFVVVLHAHWVTPQQMDVSFNLHMEKPHILVMQYEINNANR